ncbi:MAG: lipid-A-disaccharide synthase N-terminal domain-containing protein [Acidobacteriota bacterium]
MHPWLIIGFVGQTLFFSRFLVQWIVAERRGESVVPDSFWYLSLAGGVILLTYAIYTRDPVFITGQAGGAFVYTRNLMLIHRKKRSAAARTGP